MSTAGGHTIGRAVFDALRITKAVDLASPKLMELAAQGKIIPKAKLGFFRADGSGTGSAELGLLLRKNNY